MAEKKVREAEKSSLTISFNSKEECLLQKKILSLDAMKKQAMDSVSLDQKVLYNRFTLRLRRSELAHARLIGKRDIIKQLTHTMFSSFNSTLNDGTEEAVRTILKNSKSLRASSAPCRPMSCWSINSENGRREGTHYGKVQDSNNEQGIHITDFKSRNTCYKVGHRFKSAPGQKQVTFYNLDGAEKENITFINSLAENQKSQKAEEGTAIMNQLPENASVIKNKYCTDISWPESGPHLLRKRPKTANGLIDAGRPSLESHAGNKDISVTERMDFENRFKMFIEKVKSMQDQDSALRDYYSKRLLDGLRKEKIAPLVKNVDEEQRQWLPVGDESHHRSVTVKKLDLTFSKKDVPGDILFIEQYNLVLTKENFTVRKWQNNNPYEAA